MAWQGLFKHLKKLPTNDYHEFKQTHEVWIEAWWLYYLLTYVLII
jgi:hypothetical protein